MENDDETLLSGSQPSKPPPAPPPPPPRHQSRPWSQTQTVGQHFARMCGYGDGVDKNAGELLRLGPAGHVLASSLMHPSTVQEIFLISRYIEIRWGWWPLLGQLSRSAELTFAQPTNLSFLMLLGRQDFRRP